MIGIKRILTNRGVLFNAPRISKANSFHPYQGQRLVEISPAKLNRLAHITVAPLRFAGFRVLVENGGFDALIIGGPAGVALG